MRVTVMYLTSAVALTLNFIFSKESIVIEAAIERTLLILHLDFGSKIDSPTAISFIDFRTLMVLVFFITFVCLYVDDANVNIIFAKSKKKANKFFTK